MMAYHPAGMQPPGMAPGQPMAPAQTPGPQMGQPPGQGMPPGMHPGMAGPNVPQGQPVMGGMPPGMAPNAHAMQHLQPQGPAVFQNPQMAQAFQQGQQHPAMFQSQALMRQRQAMMQAAQQGGQGGQGGPMMGMPYGAGMSPAQLQAMQNNPQMRQQMNLQPHMQGQMVAPQEQNRLHAHAQVQARQQAQQAQQAQQMAAHQMAMQNSQSGNPGQPGHPGQQQGQANQQGQQNQQAQAPQMKPQPSMQGSTDSQGGPSPPQQQQQGPQAQGQGQGQQQQQTPQQQRAQNQQRNQQESQQQQQSQQTQRKTKQNQAQQAQNQANQQTQQNQQQQNQNQGQQQQATQQQDQQAHQTQQQGQQNQQAQQAQREQQGQEGQQDQNSQQQQAQAQHQQQMLEMAKRRQQAGQNPAIAAAAWQRQQQLQNQSLLAPNAMANFAAVRLKDFTDRLSLMAMNRHPHPDEILLWQTLVEEFFADDGMLRTKFRETSDAAQWREVEICVAALPRYFWTQFNSGVSRLQIFFAHPTEINLPNSTRYIECPATYTYWYDNGSQVTCDGQLKAVLGIDQKFEEVEFLTDSYEELLPRHVIESLFPAESPVKDSPKMTKTPAKVKKQQQNRTIKYTDLPKSPIHRVGVNKAVNQFFEIAHTLTSMRTLVTFAQQNSHLSPQEALDQLVEVNKQGQNNMQRYPMIAQQGQQQQQLQAQMNMAQNAAFQQQFAQGNRTPGMNGPQGQAPFASPAHANLQLPNQNNSNTSSPHMRAGGGAGGHTPSPRQGAHMIAQHSQQSASGNASGQGSSNASPNVTNKRRRSTAKGDGEDAGGAEVNGNIGDAPQAKVKQSPKPGAKRQKSGLA